MRLWKWICMVFLQQLSILEPQGTFPAPIMLLTFTFKCWGLHKTFWPLRVSQAPAQQDQRWTHLPSRPFLLFTHLWLYLISVPCTSTDLEPWLIPCTSTHLEPWLVPCTSTHLGPGPRNPRRILKSSFIILQIINFGKIHLLNWFHHQFLPWTTANAFFRQDFIIHDWSCAMTSLLIMSQPCLFKMNFSF